MLMSNYLLPSLQMNFKPTNRFLLVWYEHHVNVGHPALCIPVSGYVEYVFFYGQHCI